MENYSRAEAPEQGTCADRQDLTLAVSVGLPPLLPDGMIVQVAFIRADQKVLWKTLKMFLHFKVVEPGEWFGESLWMACNVPKRPGPGSKFVQAWMLATGGRPPRREKPSTTVFRGKIFFARTRVVRQASDGKRVRPRLPQQQYSVIDELIEIAAGAPS